MRQGNYYSSLLQKSLCCAAKHLVFFDTISNMLPSKNFECAKFELPMFNCSRFLHEKSTNHVLICAVAFHILKNWYGSGIMYRKKGMLRHFLSNAQKK